jgi:hypothetical protein
LILLAVVCAAVSASCGSVAKLHADAGTGGSATTDGGTAGAPGGDGGATGAGGTSGGAGGAGSGGSDGGVSSSIHLHGTIGTLGAPPAPAGTVRLVGAHFSFPNPNLCNASTCLVSGGIVP